MTVWFGFQNKRVHCLDINIKFLNDPRVKTLLGGDYATTVLPEAKGTLAAVGPVCIRFNADAPEGVIVAFGMLALQHQDGKHDMWTSARSREYLKTLSLYDHRIDRAQRTKELTLRRSARFHDAQQKSGL